MKKLFKPRKYRIIAILLMFVSLLFTMCITITNVTQPTSATVGETIHITVDANLVGSADLSWIGGSDSQNLVFGFLAPVSWDVVGTGVVTYTTSAGNGTMSLVPLSELAPNSDAGLTWADDMKDQLGIGDNYGQVKWVVYKSNQKLSVSEGETITGQVQLSVKVGPDNLITQLGYVLANTAYGVDVNDGWFGLMFTDCMEVTGGTNATKNLCGPIPSSVTYKPDLFTYDDVISLDFDAKKGTEGNPTPLFDASQVYLCAKAKVNGLTVDVCQINESTKFRNVGSNLWEITIWPRQLFGVLPGQEITDISFTVTNEAGDIVVQDPETGEDFQIVPNCN